MGLPMFCFPLIILGGIYWGLPQPRHGDVRATRNFTFVYYLQVWGLTEYSKILTQSGTIAATILIIMAATSVLSYICYEQIPSYNGTDNTVRYIADCFHTRYKSLTPGWAAF